MKFVEINKCFTKKVSEWMANGYEINVGTMRGSQGEIAHIDLTNGKEIVRIYIDTDHETLNDYRHYCNVIKIVVGKINDIKPYVNNDIIWNNKLNVVDKTTLYEIHDGSGWYGTKDEFEAAEVKRSERYKNKKLLYKKDVTELPMRKEIAVKVLKKVRGFKRVKANDIEKITRCESNGIYPYCYEVIVKGNCVRIQRDGIYGVK